MDRKAVGFYAVAASASLGVLLSAGCGTDSAQPARMAQRDTRSSVPAPIVVVSPEPNFFGPERTSTTTAGSSEQAVAVGKVVDPYAESNAETPLASEIPVIDDNVAAGASDMVAESDAVADDWSTETEAMAPVAAELASTVEFRFADGETPDEVSDAEKTISLNFGPKGKSAPRKSAPSGTATAMERRTLQPLVVTPRRVPGQPTPAEQAKVEPTVANEEPQPETIVPEEVVALPTPAKLAAKQPTVTPAEPVVASKLMPARVAIAATQPLAAPMQVEAAPPKAPEPVVEAETPAPRVAKLVVAEPKLAEPAPAQAVAEKSPAAVPQEVAQAEPAKVQPVVEAAAPKAVELAAPAPQPEPVAASPSTLRMAEVQVAPTPAPLAAVSPAEAKPAEVVAPNPAPQTPQPAAVAAAVPAPVAAPQLPVAPQPTVAQNQPAPILPAPAQVAAQAAPPVAQPPAAVEPAPVQAAPVQPAPAQPQPVVAMPALPTAPVRSPALVASMAQADERVRHAIQLAEKGAMYASRKEFTGALTLISQARDIEFGTRQYSQATAAGLQALKEANDFVKPGAATANISRIVAGHKTPILKDLDVSDLPPSLAAQHYYDYAKVQLAGGIGRETVGSIALYGLGRIIVAGAGANARQMEYTGPAMALYQAALICEPQNFRAAHELGVLLASSGQLELARNMLLGSASASPQPMMWKNLAVVHSRLGEAQLAAEAHQKATVLEQTSPNANTPAVRWVDPATFSHLGSTSDPTLPPNTARPATASPAEAVPAKKPSNVARSRGAWDPLNLRR